MSPELFQPTHTQKWLITVIKLSGVQFDLKSYAWFKNWTKAQRGELDLKPQVNNCTSRSSITTLLQPFWNRRIHRIQSVQLFYWSSSRSRWKRETKMASHLIFSMRQKWCDVRAKMVRFKTEMMFFRTGMRPIRTDVIYGKKLKCDSWINHTGENQSDYRDHQWFQNAL